MLFFFHFVSNKFLKVPMTRNFLGNYLAYHVYKPIPVEEKFQKNVQLGFSGPKVLLFCLRSVS